MPGPHAQTAVACAQPSPTAQLTFAQCVSAVGNLVELRVDVAVRSRPPPAMPRNLGSQHLVCCCSCKISPRSRQAPRLGIKTTSAVQQQCGWALQCPWKPAGLQVIRVIRLQIHHSSVRQPTCNEVAHHLRHLRLEGPHITQAAAHHHAHLRERGQRGGRQRRVELCRPQPPLLPAKAASCTPGGKPAWSLHGTRASALKTSHMHSGGPQLTLCCPSATCTTSSLPTLAGPALPLRAAAAGWRGPSRRVAASGCIRSPASSAFAAGSTRSGRKSFHTSTWASWSSGSRPLAQASSGCRTRAAPSAAVSGLRLASVTP